MRSSARMQTDVGTTSRERFRAPEGPMSRTERAPSPHVTVMAGEATELLLTKPDGWYVDGTVGCGGHAARLSELSPACRILGVDRDPEALALAAARLEGLGAPAELVQGSYADLPELAE